MRRINQADYYVGALVVSLLNSTKSVPAIFDETGESRRLQITTNTGDHNLYVKHTSAVKHSTVRKRPKKTWIVPFTEQDIAKLKEDFPKEGYSNAVALVLSSEDLNSTKVAVLRYEHAMACLSTATCKGYRYITVTRYGNEHHFTCYGATQKEVNGIKVFVNHSRYFDETEADDDVS